jgi:hypothetical protein
MAATDHLQLQLFDPANYKHRYQGGKVTTSDQERDENDAYLTMQQQRQSGWPRQYGERT